MFRTKNGFLTFCAVVAVMFCGLMVGCWGGEDIKDDGMAAENGGQSMEEQKARWDELFTEAKAKLADGRLKEAETAINEAKAIKKTSDLKEVYDSLEIAKEELDGQKAYDWLMAAKQTKDNTEKIKMTSYALSAGISEKNVWIAHLWRGRAYMNLKMSAKAEEDFDWVLDMKPDNPTAHYYLGVLNYRSKSYEAAVTHFEDAANAAPDQLEYLFWMGLAKQGAGDLAGARDSYQRYIDEGGTKKAEKAQQYIERLEEKLGG